MRRLGVPVLTAFALFASAPRTARAGGVEFPADGTIGLGRGGTGFLRADDPSVMMRNPALLADLWDNQVLLGAHFLIPDACFRPTGGYGWAVQDQDVSDFGDGPIYLQAEPGSTDLEGNPIEGYNFEPYPTVCYDGPMPFLPTLALSSKLSDELGVGIGFFAPEVLSLSQFGNSDGTVDTPQGLRPSPTRYFRAHLNVSYASLMGSVGYRPAKWLRIGAGFQWTLVVFNARTFTVPSGYVSPRADIRSDTFGRDLFIPGFVASVHLVPHDNLDVGFGFKWQDNIRSKAKLDLTANTFGTGSSFSYLDPSGMLQTVQSPVPNTTPNQQGSVDTTPVWAPQLSFGIRYGHRLVPRSSNWDATRKAVGDAVEDHMSTELFDVELTVVYYFNEVFDETVFANQNATIKVSEGLVTNVGECTKHDPESGDCVGRWEVPLELRGKNLWSLRLGGDYNVLPGKLALRGGLSYETDGGDREYLDIHNYMFKRVGVHAGLTWRVASHTDFSFAYAHFFLDDIKLQVQQESTLPRTYKTAEYGFEPGEGVQDANLSNEDADNDFDGVARREVPYGNDEGPNYVNAGKLTYALDVLSIAFTQHF